MDEESIVKVPVAERRGVWSTYGGNTWFSVSFAGGIDAVSSALERAADVGIVERDVTQQVLEKKLPVPDGRWALLVELTGSDWVHYANPEMLNPFGRDFGIGSKLAEQTSLRCLTTGHEDCSSATFVELQNGTQQVLRFESTGEDFDAEIENFEDWDGSIATTFKSDTHPTNWWRQFSGVKEVHQALVSEMGAYVPFIQALPTKNNTIELFACHPDAIAPANVRRIDLVVFGDPALARPNPANAQLADGIRNGDTEAVRTAIAAGANLLIVKDTTRTPIAYAVEALRVKEPQRVEIVRVLLEAGCDPNDGGHNEDSPLILVVGKAKALPTDAVKVAEMLLDAGADLAARTKNVFKGNATALHCALDAASMAMTHLFVSRGADINATDSAGRTPIEKAGAIIDSLRRQLGEEMASDSIRSYRRIIEYLTHVAQGGDPGQLAEQIADEQAAADSKRRRMLAHGEQFKRKMQEIGALVEEQKAETRRLLEESILAQPDKIALERQDKLFWQNAKRIEADSKKLEKAGFAQVGEFTIDGLPNIQIRGFVAPEKLLVAAIGQTTAGVTWWDVVRLFTDGTAVTATSTPIVDGIHNFEVPEFQKLYCADEPLRFFISEIGKVPANKEAIRVEASDFALRFEKYYAADIAAKKAKCKRQS